MERYSVGYFYVSLNEDGRLSVKLSDFDHLEEKIIGTAVYEKIE